MAPRKKLGTILKRDHAFTEAIGKPTDRKPNAFSMASEDLKAKLEAARAMEADASPQIQTNMAAEPDLARSVTQLEAPGEADRQTTHAAEQDGNQSRVPDTDAPKIESRRDGAVAEKPARKGTDVPPEARPKAGGARTAERVELIISITVSRNLVDRAGRWGAVAHQPAQTVLQHALKKMKSQLLAQLKTIKAGDVHRDRTDNVGYRLQSRLRFSPAEFADMEARLDPAGFGILPSMLNCYARDSFAEFLDRLMADAGY